MSPYPFVVLKQHYKPAVWKAWKVGKDLTELTSWLGFKPLPGIGGKNNEGAAWYAADLHAEARRTCVPNSDGTQWHQDGDTTPGANMDYSLVVWAASDPTEIKRVEGSLVYQPKPFEVVVFNNLEVLHRRPPHLSGERFSFRQRVIHG